MKKTLYVALFFIFQLLARSRSFLICVVRCACKAYTNPPSVQRRAHTYTHMHRTVFARKFASVAAVYQSVHYNVMYISFYYIAFFWLDLLSAPLSLFHVCYSPHPTFLTMLGRCHFMRTYACTLSYAFLCASQSKIAGQWTKTKDYDENIPQNKLYQRVDGINGGELSARRTMG